MPAEPAGLSGTSPTPGTERFLFFLDGEDWAEEEAEMTGDTALGRERGGMGGAEAEGGEVEKDGRGGGAGGGGCCC